MFGHSVWTFLEMKQTLPIFITLFIANAFVQNISVVADEQQQPQQLEPIQKYAVIGNNFTISCETDNNAPFKWRKDDVNITESDKRFHLTIDNTALPNVKYHLAIKNVDANDTGNYSCEQFGPIDGGHTPAKKQFNVLAVSIPKILSQSAARIETKISQSVMLYCVIEAHPLTDFIKTIKWIKEEPTNGNIIQKHPTTAQSAVDQTSIANRTTFNHLDKQRVNVTLDLANIFKKDNGSYSCVVEVPYDDPERIFEHSKMISTTSSILVLDAPQVSIDFVKAVGSSQVFLNWTVNNGNSPIKRYYVQYMKEGESTFNYYNNSIDGQYTWAVLNNFETNTSYQLKISAQNAIGMSPAYTYPQSVRTLSFDPVFVPTINVKGNTIDTITIGWDPPAANLLEYIHYYELTVVEKANDSKIIEKAIHPQNSRNLPYMFDNLKAFTEYTFRVRACSDLTGLCGNWSANVTGPTSDGLASAPVNLKVNCTINSNGKAAVKVQWEPPLDPNGVLTTYSIVVNGFATYKDERSRQMRNGTYGPKTKTINENIREAEFEVPFNTAYTVIVGANTRSRKLGAVATGKCSTQRSVPRISNVLWSNVRQDDRYMIKMHIQEASERDGPICGYRIYLIRMSKFMRQSFDLPPLAKLPITSYAEVHAPENAGAYIADTFTPDYFQRDIVLGDGHSIKDDMPKDVKTDNPGCRKILNGYIPPSQRLPATDFVHFTTQPPERHRHYFDRDFDPSDSDQMFEEMMHRRNHRYHNRFHRQVTANTIEVENSENGKATSAPRAEESIQIVDEQAAGNIVEQDYYGIQDGPLDPDSRYSAFVEVIVNINDTDTVSIFTDYQHALHVGEVIGKQEGEDNLTTILHILIIVLSGLIVIVLVLLTTLCVMHRVNSTKQQGNDVISLRDSLSRAFCGGRNNQSRRHLLGTTHTKPTDIGPINRDDLSQAYVQRHRDTDYGFLREFEMLPNRFNDRTTKNSDAKENIGKNRYPDIKAYDQTRVKLSERTMNGITSDYINANFVIGYKERKKFICAQGPMDGTVNDFWRMIWEQHLEIIVMLTNLEEYNKAKCAKYWPEQVNDVTKFGEITVKFDNEQRFTDYLVRELKITRSHSTLHNNVNSNGNGAGLTNGSISGDEEEERTITQYHYLVWKDFMAPELGVIRFIRQINDVYSVQRGPILVHCSAGVGRTGTLVAVDSLMQQLQDENQVSIFNTVYDMRHQRNFLVQSLKQYIFLYRALLDVAQFGNTEIHLKDLNTTVEQLKQRSNDSQCKLEIEFDKINSLLDESNKNCTAGTSEENRGRNRSDSVIPYDRNRVILTPIGPQPVTYINATFIEGYDNSEMFIITQDPMEETIADFWRMISEQNISTIVMISEIGEGPRKCPRYWADDEIEYEHILVKYMQSESCPYYTRREFNVTNFKMKDTIKVTQFQYNGWPTVEGEVPEVTRGMLELVDQTLAIHENANFASSTPIVVHCSLGTDRSSIFVTLCTLVQQLRLEKKVDVCSIVRKLRIQRSQFLNSYAQYEFVHRAIANYADLHKSDLDTSPTPSVKTNS